MFDFEREIYLGNETNSHLFIYLINYLKPLMAFRIRNKGTLKQGALPRTYTEQYLDVIKTNRRRFATPI